MHVFVREIRKVIDKRVVDALVRAVRIKVRTKIKDERW